MKQKLPPCIKRILIESGYDNEISIKSLDEGTIIEIEAFIEASRREILEGISCCFSNMYQTKQPFRFAPGHRSLILQLPNLLKRSEENVEYQTLEYVSPILNELIQVSKRNFEKAPLQHRYSDIIKHFSTYIYMIGGKNCYEILCHNLPMPKTPSICKHTFGSNEFKIQTEYRFFEFIYSL